MTSFRTAVGVVKNSAFPFVDIQGIEKNIAGTVVEVVDNHVEGGKRKLTEKWDKLNMLGFRGTVSSHRVKDSKIKHDCRYTSYMTKAQGFDVQYSFKFCSECKSTLEKKAVVFDNKENSCEIIKFS